MTHQTRDSAQRGDTACAEQHTTGAPSARARVCAGADSKEHATLTCVLVVQRAQRGERLLQLARHLGKAWRWVKQTRRREAHSARKVSVWQRLWGLRAHGAQGAAPHLPCSQPAVRSPCWPHQLGVQSPRRAEICPDPRWQSRHTRAPRRGDAHGEPQVQPRMRAVRRPGCRPRSGLDPEHGGRHEVAPGRTAHTHPPNRVRSPSLLYSRSPRDCRTLALCACDAPRAVKLQLCVHGQTPFLRTSVALSATRWWARLLLCGMLRLPARVTWVATRATRQPRGARE